ncbi:MAG: energy transducer TonB [Marinomonas sp.]
MTAALGLSLATPVSAQDKNNTLTLAPRGEWKLREYDYKCRISRSFGSGDDRTSLWIEQGGYIPSYNITLIGRPMRNTFAPQLTLQFAPEEVMTRNYIRSESSKGRPVLSMFGVPLAASAPVPADASNSDEETVDIAGYAELSADLPSANAIDLEAITQLKLGRALSRPLALPMDGFAENMQKLGKCAERVLSALQSNEGKPGTPAIPVSQLDWARKIQQNYPTYQLMKRIEGTVGVRLTIGETGRVVYCQVTRGDAQQAFNETACLQTLRHARFKPATNAAGEKIPAFYQTMITYKLN